MISHISPSNTETKYLHIIYGAVTRTRNWVIADTTKCSNYYTITADRNMAIRYKGLHYEESKCDRCIFDCMRFLIILL